MNFTFERSLEILERTSNTLDSMLKGASAFWISNNEGEDTWNVYEIVYHLIQGEKTDWIPRMEIILSGKGDKKFDTFVRMPASRGKKKELTQLLREFRKLRKKNIEILLSKKLTHWNMEEKGVHPAFGEITLSQLISTWVVHDLNHLAQVSRVMAKQYKKEVGPWIEYLGILQKAGK